MILSASVYGNVRWTRGITTNTDWKSMLLCLAREHLCKLGRSRYRIDAGRVSYSVVDVRARLVLFFGKFDRLPSQRSALGRSKSPPFPRYPARSVHFVAVN